MTQDQQLHAPLTFAHGRCPSQRTLLERLSVVSCSVIYPYENLQARSHQARHATLTCDFAVGIISCLACRIGNSPSYTSARHRSGCQKTRLCLIGWQLRHYAPLATPSLMEASGEKFCTLSCLPSCLRSATRAHLISLSRFLRQHPAQPPDQKHPFLSFPFPLFLFRVIFVVAFAKGFPICLSVSHPHLHINMGIP